MQTGIYILSPQNIVQGNFIGLSKDGKKLQELDHYNQEGIRLWTGAASGNTIGGLAPGEGNIISGNPTYNGITVGAFDPPMENNKILGNKIGTDITGTIAISNYRGISLGGASNTLIGGNLISGNSTFGLSIHDSKYTRVYNNRIGTKADGTSPMSNGSFGIHVVNGSQNNILSGRLPEKANTIAYNKRGGIMVSFLDTIGSQVKVVPRQNEIVGNRIYGNMGPGIDLNNDGISFNDRDDSDAGANLTQNFPEWSESLTLENGSLTGSLKLSSDPSFSAFPLKIDFYKSDSNGQGREYLGYIMYDCRRYPEGEEFFCRKPYAVFWE